MVALFTSWRTSVLQIPGAKDVAIKFHSLSKSNNMSGWRVGCLVGIKNLAQLKTNVDSGVFKVIQVCAITAYSPTTEVEF